MIVNKMKKIRKQHSIPYGWQIKQLGELGRVSMCKRILKNQTSGDGDIPFFKIGTFGKEPDAYIPRDLYEDLKSRYSFPEKGDILISASGTIGRTVVYDGTPAYYQDSNIIWIANDEKTVINPYLRYLYDKVQWHTASGTIARLYNDNVRRIEILAPKVNEQKRIVKVLETWDEAIEKLGQMIELKREVKKGLMQKLLTGELRLPGFNSEWSLVKLGDVSHIKTGKKDNQNKVECGKYPFFVRSPHVEQIDSYSYDGEAILVPGEGNVGKIFHYINGKFDFHQRVYKISDFDKGTVGRFVYYSLLKNFDQHVKKHSVKATVDSLRLPTFKEFEIKCPPESEQRAIVEVLDSASNEIDLLETKLKYLGDQKKYLLNNLVTGQIRTPENL